MAVEQMAAELIARHEGLRLEAYRCPAGKWTIGWGHTEGVREGQTINRAQAYTFLLNDLHDAMGAVRRIVTVPLNQAQLAALTSWVFNVGATAAARSTLVRRLNAGEYGAVPGELLRWDKARDPATGKLRQLAGLAKRRAEEAALWASAGGTEPAPGELAEAAAPRPAVTSPTLIAQVVAAIGTVLATLEPVRAQLVGLFGEDAVQFGVAAVVLGAIGLTVWRWWQARRDGRISLEAVEL